MPNYLPFYPEITPNREQHIKVSAIHSIYVASYGNPSGIPVIMLHGGPGSGTAPYFAQYFDPQLYHIILADQRGAGNSTPKGEMRENTTQHLIDDIDVIRKQFNIDKWVVFGGSWGSALALLYAEAHPSNVLGLIVRGIFLVREEDYNVFCEEGSQAAMIHRRQWEKFKQDTSALIKKANLEHTLSVTSHKIYHIYFRLLQTDNHELKQEAAGTIAAWEKLNSYLKIDPKELEWSRSPDGENMGLTEATYFEHHAFIEHNQILNNIGKIAGIPVWIVQGMYDLVCPPYMANQLEDALLAINENKNLITRYDCVAGHAQQEEAIRHALIMSQIQLANSLQ
ncbi:MAG: prolyl aminopeptidase [Legionellaceae bacterium]|nr:prolyl aminopeptidase [Legionellaceae bacterium]